MMAAPIETDPTFRPGHPVVLCEAEAFRSASATTLGPCFSRRCRETTCTQKKAGTAFLRIPAYRNPRGPDGGGSSKVFPP